MVPNQVWEEGSRAISLLQGDGYVSSSNDTERINAVSHGVLEVYHGWLMASDGSAGPKTGNITNGVRSYKASDFTQRRDHFSIPLRLRQL
jgi:hypothetical protein